MTTINLYQNEQTAKAKNSNKSGLFFILGIFIFILLIWAGLKIATNMLQKQNEELQTQIVTENNSLSGDNVEQVADMQARLAEIKDNLQIKNGSVSRVPMSQIIEYVADNINSSGVFLTSYKYEEGGKITLSLDANSFSDAAKQIFNLKNSKYFSDVVLSKIARGEKYIEFDISMKVKQ